MCDDSLCFMHDQKGIFVLFYTIKFSCVPCSFFHLHDIFYSLSNSITLNGFNDNLFCRHSNVSKRVDDRRIIEIHPHYEEEILCVYNNEN